MDQNHTATPPSKERGTRPSVFSHLLYDRGVRFAAGLAVVVAIPVAVLFYFQFRALSDVETTSSVVLRQLSADTADAISKALSDTLKHPQINILLRVTSQRTEPLDLTWIDSAFQQGLQQSPFIDEIWVWSEVSADRADKWYVFDRASLKEAPGDIDRRFRESPARYAQLMPQLRELAQQRRAIVAFTAEIDGRQKYVQVQLRFTGATRDRVSSFLGFAVDAQRLRTEFLPAAVNQRLAALQQPTGFPPLRAFLVDNAGVPLGGDSRDVIVDERSFPLVFFDRELLEFAAPYEQQRETWRLRTTYGAQTIPGIVKARTQPQTVLMILLALGMAGGVFLVAGAAAREVRLAELKSNFVASVSHDLKTPLALIQLFAETLELGRVRNSERAQEYYRIINGEARKLTRLIENLLDFSKMEAGLRPYRMAPADLTDLTKQVVEKMQSQFSQSQFQVLADVAGGLPRVLADEGAVEQAIENLLANAMKYSGDSRTIEVCVSRLDRHVGVAVTDHGIGIPRKEQKRIFRKFYRVESGLGGGPQGCGLGLAIVDHTMRGHGGFVRVESEPGRGSTFTLHFPIAKGLSVEGDVHEAHPGDRGRAANAARPA
jgi:signal transduction histidine kinase